MQDRKLNVSFCKYGYGGNGGTASILPSIADWLVKVDRFCQADPRIDKVFHITYSDTPISLTRNAAVQDARENGIDVLVMIDSDQVPDCEPGGKPFFETSFDFLYKHYDRGPTLICAPYCGPPPEECVYVFKWANFESQDPQDRWRLSMLSREEAARLDGIQECAAAPTGLLMCDLRAFAWTEPKDATEEPWFHYQYTDKYCRRKASTEDVTATRDISLAGIALHGYNPLYCNWDAWAGHAKPKIVRKPIITSASDVAAKFRRVCAEGMDATDRMINAGGGIAEYGEPAESHLGKKPIEAIVVDDTDTSFIGHAKRFISNGRPKRKV